ncbi:MAG: HlyC/CorC family transporter [Oscillospiraceae bacterium]|nr:HlyC/CorC family transporter [Oscillospiraceae bacterium]
MEGDSISLLIIIICIIMSAYFSATETAFSSLNRIRIKNMAEKGNKKAQLVLSMSENYDSMLSTILIGNNIVNILSASLATVLFVGWLGNEAGPSAATAVITVVVLIFGEVTPKSIAKESPEKFAMFSAPFLRVLMFVLTPFNLLFGLWKKLISLIVKSDENRSITEEELITIVEEAEQEGGLDEEESTLIRSAIEFSEIEVKDILTPRIYIEGVPEDATEDEIAALFTETGYSRLPVYKDTVDHITGVIYHKDFYNYIYRTGKDISGIIRPAIFVTPNKKIDELLKELQMQKSHIAFILDEYAGTIGLVTLEDIMEELVGEIWDEHDDIVEEIIPVSDNEYTVLGSANIEVLFEKFDISEEIDVMTASGWVMNVLERIPAQGDSFEYKNLQVTVTEMDENRVGKIDIIVKETETE